MKRRAKILLPLGILAAGGLGVALIWLTQPVVESTRPDVPAPLVRVRRVEPRPVDFVVRAHGTVAPRTESDLIPQVSGPVVWVSPALASGGFFEDGEPLIRIDRADYEVALESARAAVARGESEYERAHKELERQQRLAKQSVASAARFDDAVNAERIAAAVLREARAKLERAERDLERTEIRAPYAGRVREENVDVGQFVTRGTPIGRIYAVDYAEVRLPVPDAELGFMDLPLLYRDETPEDGGPSVLLRARFAGGEHTWTGRIVRTEGEIDARSRMVNIVARVEDPYGRGGNSDREDSDEAIAVTKRERPPLAVGLFVEAEIRGRRVESAVILPRSALRDGNRVLVVDAAGRLHFRDVEVLRKQREEVVIGDGLAAGEDVVVSPLPAVVNGMEVNVARDEPDQAGLADHSTDSGAKRSAVASARP